MKISTNSFGNYKPVNIPKQNDITKTNKIKSENKVDITKEEKKFFTKLYPENEEQINQYHFYNKDGNKKGMLIGSLFDKRG